ncbi:uncharacterized protein [Acropora muricata]|uniref:uncharacterized protein n=1 Tax=Acropora muricata TaxID=159855 RepID=UPI001CF1001C|nr:uncharacterized protein LOC114971553 isoform X2 [Acropora millepora]
MTQGQSHVALLLLVVSIIKDSTASLLNYEEYSDQCKLHSLDNDRVIMDGGCDAIINCQRNKMSIALPRALLSGVNREDLCLLHPNCKAVDNGTHFVLTTKLIDCGTLSKHTDKNVVYSNMVRHVIPSTSIITRAPQVKIHFSCHYSKYGVASTGGITMGDSLDAREFSGRGFELVNNFCRKERYFPYRQNPTCSSKSLAHSIDTE